MRFLLAFALPALLLTACQNERSGSERDLAADRSARSISMLGGPEGRPTDDDFARTRSDTTWRQFRTVADGQRAGARSAGTTGRALDAAAVDRYADALRVPLSGDAEGRAVFYAQVLLDRAGFSPGQIDGQWGQNTEKAVYWFQEREGLGASGTLDRETLERLVSMADAPDRPEDLVVSHTLSEGDVEGPFRTIPEDIYAQAEMDRLGYESLGEKLGEQFHASPDYLRSLNDGRSLDGLSAGESLRVPAVRSGTPSGRESIDRLVISDGGRYLHALSADGQIIYHFPTTLGSDYDPSPAETLEITSITREPDWHYQPSILAHVDDSEEDAFIPAGPNNAVGMVWMDLSKEHYGIHGTAEPGTIGYATSAGCVRLTNWDALFLADRIEPGITVEFRDVNGRG